MGRRYYRYRKRTPIDPLQGILSSIVALALIAGLVWCIFGALSQPNISKFSLGVTPTPKIATNTTTFNMDTIGIVGFLAICAIAIGAGGLIVLGLIWLGWKFLKQPKTSPAITKPVPPSIMTQSAQAILSPTTITPGAENESSNQSGRQVVNSQVNSNPISLTVEQTNVSNLQPKVNLIPSAQNSFQPTPIQWDVFVPNADTAKSDVDAKSVLSTFERSFFWVLSAAVKNDFYIFPQIALADLARHTQTRWLERDLQWMLDRGIIDFVLANPTTLDAVVAFEFDDPSHRQADAQARDRRKNRLMDHIGICLLRFKSGEKWNADILRKQILDAAASSTPISFLKDSECQVFKLLREAKENYYIFPQVPLEKIILRKEYLDKDTYLALKNESVDFLIAHPKYLGTMFVVSHKQLKFTETGNLLEQAKIPWICFNGDRYPPAIELREKINQIFPKWQ